MAGFEGVMGECGTGFNCKISAAFTDNVFQKFSYCSNAFAMVFVPPFFGYVSLTVIFQTELLSVASLNPMFMQCPLHLNLV